VLAYTSRTREDVLTVTYGPMHRVACIFVRRLCVQVGTRGTAAVLQIVPHTHVLHAFCQRITSMHATHAYIQGSEGKLKNTLTSGAPSPLLWRVLCGVLCSGAAKGGESLARTHAGDTDLDLGASVCFEMLLCMLVTVRIYVYDCAILYCAFCDTGPGDGDQEAAGAPGTRRLWVCSVLHEGVLYERARLRVSLFCLWKTL
jgi:hypothetical protein